MFRIGNINDKQDIAKKLGYVSSLLKRGLNSGVKETQKLVFCSDGSFLNDSFTLNKSLM